MAGIYNIRRHATQNAENHKRIRKTYEKRNEKRKILKLQHTGDVH